METPEKTILFLTDMHINSIFAPSHEDYDKIEKAASEFKRNLFNDRRLLTNTFYSKVKNNLKEYHKDEWDYLFITSELIELIGNKITDSKLEMIDSEEGVIIRHSADFIKSIPGVIPGKTKILMCRGSLPHVLKLDTSEGENDVATLLSSKEYGFDVKIDDLHLATIKWGNDYKWYYLLIHQLKQTALKNPHAFQEHIAMWLKRKYQLWIDNIDLTVLFGHNHSAWTVDPSWSSNFTLVRAPGMAMLDGSKYARKLDPFTERIGGYYTIAMYKNMKEPLLSKEPIILKFESNTKSIVEL